MKKAFAICLGISILLISAKELVVYAFFKLNQPYITENICVNKKSPEVNCQGKCFFTKTIKNEEKSQKKAPLPTLEEEQKTLFSNYFLSVYSPHLEAANRPHFYEDKLCTALYHSRLLRPPRV